MFFNVLRTIATKLYSLIKFLSNIFCAGWLIEIKKTTSAISTKGHASLPSYCWTHSTRATHHFCFQGHMYNSWRSTQNAPYKNGYILL
jgi:hypothetical protein